MNKLYDKNGQGLLTAMIAVLITGMSMMALTRVMSAASRQQTDVQRKEGWITTKANLVSILQNKSACTSTVNQVTTLSTTGNPVPILNSDGSTYLKLNQDLGSHLYVSGINLVAITDTTPATKTYVMGQGDCSGYIQNGNGNTYKKIAGSVGNCPIAQQVCVSDNTHDNNCDHGDDSDHGNANCNNYVQDPNYQPPSANKVQQAKLVVSATYPVTSQTYTAEYYVNVNIVSNKVAGCN